MRKMLIKTFISLCKTILKAFDLRSFSLRHSILLFLLVNGVVLVFRVKYSTHKIQKQVKGAVMKGCSRVYFILSIQVTVFNMLHLSLAYNWVIY